MDCSPPGSSVHGIVQARILEGVAMPSSRGSSQPRDQTQVFRIAGGFFTIWATRADAIIGGEISNKNAAAIWALMGSGHDNCMATIHAESPEAAYEAFIKCIMEQSPYINVEKTMQEMQRKLHVVQIVRDGNIRGVTAIT